MPARRTLALDAAVAALIACSVLAITAIAHSGKSAYPTQWERDKSVGYQFDGSMSAAYRNRVVAAAKQWNKLRPALSFDKQKGNAQVYPQGECGNSYQSNVITERSLNGPLGFTTWCLFDGSGEIYSFQLAIDKKTNFYTGKGKPPSEKYDLFSTVLHEFGHAQGRSDHYRDNASFCKKGGGEVMCSTMSPGVKRNVQKHDKHTFDSAY
ncbi:MAG TPA: hypothetical protein VD766_04880 [Solirubrobacterales bacterium]|nr:hypothetical protein [Solirubrobacterales bacterium]